MSVCVCLFCFVWWIGEQIENRQVLVNKSIPTVTNPSLASEFDFVHAVTKVSLSQLDFVPSGIQLGDILIMQK